MSFIFLLVATFLFAIAAICDFGWFGASSDHLIGLLALGLVAFVLAHFAWPPYFKR